MLRAYHDICAKLELSGSFSGVSAHNQTIIVHCIFEDAIGPAKHRNNARRNRKFGVMRNEIDCGLLTFVDKDQTEVISR